MNNIPNSILCQVVKKSTWVRLLDDAQFKSITFEIVPGRYFVVGDENSQYDWGEISLTASITVPCFWDKFEVGQKVELKIEAEQKSKKTNGLDFYYP